MIEFKLENFEEIRRTFDPALVDKALTSALRKTANKAKTKVSKKVREEWNVKVEDINRHANDPVIRWFDGDPQAALVYIGSKLGLINFSPKRLAKNRGVSVKVKKKERPKVAVGFGNKGFIATANKGTQIFARQTKERLPLIKLTGPSIPEMVGKEDTVEAFQSFAGDEYSRQFIVAMDYFLGRNR